MSFLFGLEDVIEKTELISLWYFAYSFGTFIGAGLSSLVCTRRIG
nr:MAG TPA: hypothetical protein [Caudoviricetes sp.]